MPAQKPSFLEILKALILSSPFLILIGSLQCGCGTLKKTLGINDDENLKPISNPFYSYHPNASGENPPMILRSKKGDRSFEVEIPDRTQQLSDFVIPLSPEFSETKGGSLDHANRLSNDGNPMPDDTYKARTANATDHEITRGFSQGSLDSISKRTEIEHNLNLMPSEEETPREGAPSYLAGMDHIKQLYRTTRFEAALLETDDMIRKYQTDPQLYQMRGTLLERLGRKEMALKSWSQSLRLDPKNDSLRKFVDRKQPHATVESP